MTSCICDIFKITSPTFAGANWRVLPRANYLSTHDCPINVKPVSAMPITKCFEISTGWLSKWKKKRCGHLIVLDESGLLCVQTFFKFKIFLTADNCLQPQVFKRIEFSKHVKMIWDLYICLILELSIDHMVYAEFFNLSVMS